MDHETQDELNRMLDAVSDLVDVDSQGGGQFSTELPIDMGSDSIQRIQYMAQCLVNSIKYKYPQFSCSVTMNGNEASMTAKVSKL